MGRMERVNQQVRREINDVLRRDMADPRLESVTVTRADVSRDLRHAKVYYSVLMNTHEVEDVQKGLDSASRAIRTAIGHRLSLRYTPELMFLHDDSIEFTARIEETLKEIQDEHQEDSTDNQCP